MDSHRTLGLDKENVVLMNFMAKPKLREIKSCTYNNLINYGIMKSMIENRLLMKITIIFATKARDFFIQKQLKGYRAWKRRTNNSYHKLFVVLNLAFYKRLNNP